MNLLSITRDIQIAKRRGQSEITFQIAERLNKTTSEGDAPQVLQIFHELINRGYNVTLSNGQIRVQL